MLVDDACNRDAASPFTSKVPCWVPEVQDEKDQGTLVLSWHDSLPAAWLSEQLVVDRSPIIVR